MDNKNPRVVIVGGVAGGASCAARARRLNEFAPITILERGKDVSFANCGLPYYIGGEIKERDKLAVQTVQSLHQKLNVDVKNFSEVTHIHREEKAVTYRNLQDQTEHKIYYDKLVLAPGASPFRPPTPGIDHEKVRTLRTLQDMDRIHGQVQEAQKILVVGAGFIGLEMAEQLVHLKKDVVLVELQDQVLPQMDFEMSQYVHQALVENGMEVILQDGVAAFEDGEQFTAKLNSGKEIQCDLVILSIGVRPESKLAKDADLEVSERGHIVVNSFQQTSDESIYAVGDVIETVDPIYQQKVSIPLGGPANRQGRVAADHIFLGKKARAYPGSIGTAIVRVFDVTCGMSGYSEKRLEQMKVDYLTTIVTAGDHASYYPGATPVTVKLIWEPSSGRIVGAQAVGKKGVDKRLDVLATAIIGKMTIEDLCHLELSYAPPFGSAKDIINIAGFAATNVHDQLVILEREYPNPEEVQVVDTRPPADAQAKPYPGSINIPYGSLRSRLNELDKNKPVVTACAVGKSSYFSARILEQEGFTVKCLVGGMRLHQFSLNKG